MRVSEKLENAKKHGVFHLSARRLTTFPLELVGADFHTTLLRIDLSFNMLTAIPEAIGSLQVLQYLWLNDNPLLTQLPISLSKCINLLVLDVSRTAIATLPCELGRLEQLAVLAIEETPLEAHWTKKNYLSSLPSSSSSSSDPASNQQEDVKPFQDEADRQRSLEREHALGVTILTRLRRKDERKQLKATLYERLANEFYHIAEDQVDRTSPSLLHPSRAQVELLLKQVFRLFDKEEELRSLIRNASRLFPLEFKDAKPARIRRQFEALREENTLKKMTADLEIRLRNLYFDRIDPSAVEDMINSIYKEIQDIKQLKFLLQHAPRIFPPEAADIDGKEIQKQLLQLQQHLAQERDAAIEKIFAIVKGIYADTEPELVRDLVHKVAKCFKSTSDLKSLASSASTVFPSEFLHANAATIRDAYLQIKQQQQQQQQELESPPSARRQSPDSIKKTSAITSSSGG